MDIEIKMEYKKLPDHKPNLSAPEPPAAANDRPASWDLVTNDLRLLIIQDMQDRDQHGQATYKTRLQPFNGRNSAIDMYQEALDHIVYMRNVVEEQRKVRELVLEMANAELYRQDEIKMELDRLTTAW